MGFDMSETFDDIMRELGEVKPNTQDDSLDIFFDTAAMKAEQIQLAVPSNHKIVDKSKPTKFEYVLADTDREVLDKGNLSERFPVAQDASSAQSTSVFTGTIQTILADYLRAYSICESTLGQMEDSCATNAP